MLKLTRHIFGWTADPACADYCERALFNGILGSQHPHDGEKLYYVNLAAGLWKLFGTPGQDYWCCTGTMSEAFSQLGDSIYFHDDGGIYVNLFIASELNWSERAVRLTQQTRFPEEEGTTLRILTARPVRFALRIRVPYWATNGGTAALNGRTLDGLAAPSAFRNGVSSFELSDRKARSRSCRSTRSSMSATPSTGGSPLEFCAARGYRPTRRPRRAR